MTYDNNAGPVYSMLTAKSCSTDFIATNLRDPGCPCRCFWYYNFTGAWFYDENTGNPTLGTSAAPGGTQLCPSGYSFDHGDPETGTYVCGGPLVDCDCTNPSPSLPSGAVNAFLYPSLGSCNGIYGMQCGVCIEGQCDYASI